MQKNKAEPENSTDCGFATARSALAWTAYPVFVLLPFAWLVLHFDIDNTALLITFAYASMLTTASLEFIVPYCRDWRRSHGDILTDVTHQFLTSFIAQFIRVFMVVGFFLLINHSSDEFSLKLWPVGWPLWAEFILALLVAEFVDYWRHRAMHEWGLAWRLHAVHHCATRVYFLNANRFHILDALINSLINAGVFALLGASKESVYLVGIFTGLHSPWQHVNADYRLGWLNWIFAGAELHRWHHSARPAECNTNYGNNLIVFDTLFGTRYLPDAQQDTLAIGLGNATPRYPHSWLGQQTAPFRWRSLRKVQASSVIPD